MSENIDPINQPKSKIEKDLAANDLENSDLEKSPEDNINIENVESETFEKNIKQSMDDEVIDESQNNYNYDDSGKGVNLAGNRDNLEEGVFAVNVKDFAYDVSDPKHFGIYDDYSSDEEYDDNEEETGEEEYNDDEEEEEKEEEEEEEEEEKEEEEKEEDADYEGQIYYGEYGNAYFGMEGTDDSIREGRERVDTEPEKNDSNSNLNVNTEHNDNHEIFHAIALYPFVPENSNELSLVPDQILIINYECGDGWLVAHDPVSGQTGLVPSEYIRMINVDDSTMDTPEYEEFADDVKDAHRFMPEILGNDNSDLTTDNFRKLEI